MRCTVHQMMVQHASSFINAMLHGATRVCPRLYTACKCLIAPFALCFSFSWLPRVCRGLWQPTEIWVSSWVDHQARHWDHRVESLGSEDHLAHWGCTSARTTFGGGQTLLRTTPAFSTFLLGEKLNHASKQARERASERAPMFITRSPTHTCLVTHL
jgi:hypothetical protein